MLYNSVDRRIIMKSGFNADQKEGKQWHGHPHQ